MSSTSPRKNVGGRPPIGGKSHDFVGTADLDAAIEARMHVDGINESAAIRAILTDGVAFAALVSAGVQLVRVDGSAG